MTQPVQQTTQPETKVPSDLDINKRIAELEKEIEGLKNKKWILVDNSEWTNISTADKKIYQTTIKHNFNDISEVSFRALGKDNASFGYITIPTELWHNAGTFELGIPIFNLSGSFMGASKIWVISKTENNFTLKAEVVGGFAFAYKLK